MDSVAPMGLAKEHLNKLGSDRQRAINGRAGQVSAQAANTYDPRLDNRHRGFPNYIGDEATPYQIGTAPPDRDNSLIMTHDIDFSHFLLIAWHYGKAIRDRGHLATFFI